MQSYIFLDLDDTLFQTRRKCTVETESRTLQARAYLSDGTPNSFATYKQQWLWQWLHEGFKCVPVTGRDRHAFDRVDLPFHEEIVLNHGAVILDKQRNIDTTWMNAVLQSLPEFHAKLMRVWTDIETYARLHQGYKPQLIHDFDITWYGVIKHESGSEAALKYLLDIMIKPHPSIQDGSLYWHLNGNNLAVLPRIINKQSAVSYLIDNYRQQHAGIITFGAGDSHSDAAFMTLCDYALIPKNTQLFNRLSCIE
ncbi:MAG: hydrolase [Methylococcaceae bacterium]|nr:hydrolase [Methylococcaceae bacterium]